MNFNCIRELIDYIPQCIVCGKQIPIVITTNSFYNKDFKSLSGYLYLKTKILDNKLISMNKNYPFIIDIDNNFIIEGAGLVNKILLSSSGTGINKSCKTCNVAIYTMYHPFHFTNEYKYGFFPSSELKTEFFSYTIRKNKKISIEREYYYFKTVNRVDSYKIFSSLQINNKYIDSPVPGLLSKIISDLDITKVNNFNSLNKKINMFLTFQ